MSDLSLYLDKLAREEKHTIRKMIIMFAVIYEYTYEKINCVECKKEIEMHFQDTCEQCNTKRGLKSIDEIFFWKQSDGVT